MKNLGTSIITAVIVVVFLAIGGFTSLTSYAQDLWMTIEVDFDVGPGMHPARVVNLALYYRGQPTNDLAERMGTMIVFEPDFTTASLDNLEIRIVNGNGWSSDQLAVPLSEFTNYGNGLFRYTWTVFEVGTTPEPPTQPPNSGILQFTIGSTTYVNGGTTNTLEAAPFLSEDGRTMVPVRAIVEGLGSTDVGFNTATQEVTFSLDGQQFALTIGQQLTGNNGETMGAPVIVAGRTFVPARFVSESVGAQVSWDGATQTVSISK